MKKIHGKMWIDNNKYELKELLGYIPDNNWEWYIYEFSGVGIAPNNLDMPAFEELVLSLDFGYQMSWTALKQLANSLEDIDTILVVASNNKHSYDEVSSSEFRDFFVRLIYLTVQIGRF